MIISYFKLGKNLKELRKMANITQEELAEITGINQNSISRIENGERSGNISTIDRIVRAIQNRNPELSDILLSFSKTTGKSKKSI